MTDARLETVDNILYCQGCWTLEAISTLEQQLLLFSWPQTSKVYFDGQAIERMDTAGAWLLYKTHYTLTQMGYQSEFRNFSQEHQHLLKMMADYLAQHQPPLPEDRVPFLERVGRSSIAFGRQVIDFLAFVGETFIVLLHSLASPRRMRWQALVASLYSAGFTALPIIGLMAFLTGIVLAYQGGIQLSTYGANIFIVDLVGLTLLRELSPLLTAIIVAGRSGSAYTAQIGTMRVTEEIDALRTLGIGPLELLVVPKLLALLILMPLLTAFADALGVLGGMLIAKTVLDVNVNDFLDRFPKAVSITHYLIGIGKAPVFAAVIALVGCYQGFQVSGGADSVGRQVTISVVQGIFLVIIVDAVFSVLFSWLGI